MLIDWFTVVAQIVNFLVLVALMKRFLYRRLLRLIDERQQRIASRLAEAEQKRLQAERQTEQLRSQAAEQERQRDAMLVQCRQEADQQREELVQKARDSVRKLEARWRDDLERERAAFLNEIRRRAAVEMLAIIRRALADLAASEVQHSAVEVFLEKLRSLDPSTLRELASGELTVSTALELPGETQDRIRKTLEDRLGSPVTLRFARAPAMAWGIELRGNGRRLGWNSDSYVEALEENLKEALERQSHLVAG